MFCIILATTSALNSLHALLAFDAAKVNFSAKFPINWSPILSEQHQHLKHPQHIHSESINYTKHWKNMINVANTNGSNAASTSKSASSLSYPRLSVGAASSKIADSDLTVEIYLNKPIQIGCIQIKLKFGKELTSAYELTLTKPQTNADAEYASANQRSNTVSGNANILYFSFSNLSVHLYWHC